MTAHPCGRWLPRHRPGTRFYCLPLAHFLADGNSGVQPVCNRCASGVQAVQPARNRQAIIYWAVCIRPPCSLQFALHTQSPRTQCSNYFEIEGYVNTYIKTALAHIQRIGKPVLHWFGAPPSIDLQGILRDDWQAQRFSPQAKRFLRRDRFCSHYAVTLTAADNRTNRFPTGSCRLC